MYTYVALACPSIELCSIENRGVARPGHTRAAARASAHFARASALYSQ